MEFTVNAQAAQARTQARTQLDQLIGNGSKHDLLGTPVQVPADKDLNRKGIAAFLNLVREAHGDEAHEAASGQLKSHYDDGRPLSAYEAKQIVTNCTMHSINQIALEKEALKHVPPEFHEHARHYFNEHVGRLGLPRNTVLTSEQLSKHVTTLLAGWQPLQDASRKPLPTSEQMMEWAGPPKEDKTLLFLTMPKDPEYKAILGKLDEIHQALESLSSRDAVGQFKQIVALNKSLSELEAALLAYVKTLKALKTRGDNRIPQMEALLQQVRSERSRVDGAYSFHMGNMKNPIQFSTSCTVSGLVDLSLEGALRQMVAFEAPEIKVPTTMTRDAALLILGFAEGSTPSAHEISNAYHVLALQNHPDRHPEERSRYEERMKAANAAHDFLAGK